ncbi:hypothetical protein [Agaricicola taiwanensis]|uniref:hypothetical protein n=1 Tax=Agaricicola taiwanensis TaxID=591372 RepID=UPI003FCDBB80
MGKWLWAAGWDTRPQAMMKKRPTLAASAGAQVDGLGAFPLRIRLDVEQDALTLDEAAHPGLLHRADVNENVATSIIWTDEAITFVVIEEFHDTALRHRISPAFLAVTLVLKRRHHLNW